MHQRKRSYQITKRNSSLRNVIGKIPAYKLQPIRKMVVRVTTSNADALLDSLTIAQIAKLVGFHCVVTNTTAFYLASQFRLDMVEMWATPPATADTVTVGLKWADSPLAASVGIANPPVTIEDSSGTPNVYAHVVLRPQKNSLAENWFGSAATSALLLVNLESTAGNATATLDFHFSWILDDIGSTPSFTVTAATAGVVYHGIITGSTGLVYTPIPPLNAGQ
jgi:hypothetical protein